MPGHLAAFTEAPRSCNRPPVTERLRNVIYPIGVFGN